MDQPEEAVPEAPEAPAAPPARARIVPRRTIPDMACAKCGARTQVRAVSFGQNVGMLVVRHTTTVAGTFCGPCILSTFWSCTLTTAIVGWFGAISLLITPFLILLNVIELMRSARLVGWGKVMVGVLTVLAIPAAAVAILAIMYSNSTPTRRR